MAVQISIAKGTSNPTSSTGLTLGEPVFNYANNTFWMGKGSGVTPIWLGAGICGASGGIAAGLTYQIPTLGAVKDYFSAVSSNFLGTTASYVSSFNGLTGAVQGVSAAVAGTGISVSGATGAVTITNIGVQSFNGLTGAVTGVTVGGANTFTALNTFNAGISAAGGVTFANDIFVNSLRIGQGPVSGSSNTAIGDNTLTLLESGTSNTAIGSSALASATGGDGNVAIGSGAMAGGSNAGNNNVAIGDIALSSNNGGNNIVGIGYGALGGAASNSDSTAIGNFSLGNISTGSRNTAIGSLAGSKRTSAGLILTSATGGIYIGYDARGSANAQTNEIVIGTLAVGLGSNTAVIGATAQTSATIYGLVNAPSGINASGGATLSSNTTIPSGATLTVNGNFVANGNVNLGDAVTDAITVTGVLAANGGLSAAGGTFSSLTRFTAGISSAGGTFSSLTRFTAGITASTLYVSGGVTFAGALSAVDVYATSVYVSGGIFPSGSNTLNLNTNGSSITNIGDVNNDNSNTNIQVDDSTGTITLSAPVGGINNFGGFLNQVSAPSFADTYSFCQTYRATTTATTANQTIATVPSVYDDGEIPPVMGYPAFEVTISARDTVLNKVEMLKMLVVQDGTNTVNTQYGLIRTGATGPVSSYSTTLSGTPKNLLIRATPLSTNSTTFTTTVRAQNNG